MSSIECKARRHVQHEWAVCMSTESVGVQVRWHACTHSSCAMRVDGRVQDQVCATWSVACAAHGARGALAEWPLGGGGRLGSWHGALRAVHRGSEHTGGSVRL